VRCGGVLGREVDYSQIDFGLQSIEGSARDGPVATTEDDKTFDDTGRRDDGTAVGGERSRDLLGVRILSL
jgi:hypothetical protein